MFDTNAVTSKVLLVTRSSRTEDNTIYRELNRGRNFTPVTVIQGSQKKKIPENAAWQQAQGRAGRHSESSALCYRAGRRLSSMSCRDSSFSPSPFAAFPSPSYVGGSRLAGGPRGAGGPRPPRSAAGLRESRGSSRPCWALAPQALRPVSAAGLLPNTRRGLSARGGERPSRAVAGEAGIHNYPPQLRFLFLVILALYCLSLQKTERCTQRYSIWGR